METLVSRLNYTFVVQGGKCIAVVSATGDRPIMGSTVAISRHKIQAHNRAKGSFLQQDCFRCQPWVISMTVSVAWLKKTFPGFDALYHQLDWMSLGDHASGT